MRLHFFHFSKLATLAACAAALGAAGCGSSGNASPADSGGDSSGGQRGDGSAATDDGSGDDGGTADGSSSGSSSAWDGAAGTCAVAPSGGCNALGLQGGMVTATLSSQTAPVLDGGPIADGTYVLMAMTVYSSSSVAPTPQPQRQTITTLQGCMQLDSSIDGTSSASIATNGAQLVMNQVCPSTATQSCAYAATAGSLSLECDPFAGTIASAPVVYAFTRL